MSKAGPEHFLADVSPFCLITMELTSPVSYVYLTPMKRQMVPTHCGMSCLFFPKSCPFEYLTLAGSASQWVSRGTERPGARAWF